MSAPPCSSIPLGTAIDKNKCDADAFLRSALLIELSAFRDIAVRCRSTMTLLMAAVVMKRNKIASTTATLVMMMAM